METLKQARDDFAHKLSLQTVAHKGQLKGYVCIYAAYMRE